MSCTFTVCNKHGQIPGSDRTLKGKRDSANCTSDSLFKALNSALAIPRDARNLRMTAIVKSAYDLASGADIAPANSTSCTRTAHHKSCENQYMSSRKCQKKFRRSSAKDNNLKFRENAQIRRPSRLNHNSPNKTRKYRTAYINSSGYPRNR